MLRNLAFVVGYALILVLFTTASVRAAEFGTAEEAKAMLERAVAAVKEDKAKALDMFNKGEGGFKDRDLYVWCANASDGIVTAQPYMKGCKQLRDIKGKHGAPFGEKIMQNATEGTIKETTYWWPRPGLDEPLEKDTFYTKVGTKSVGSATTRNNPPGTYVRLWHYADICASTMSANDPKRTFHDIKCASAPLMPSIYRSRRMSFSNSAINARMPMTSLPVRELVSRPQADSGGGAILRCHQSCGNLRDL